MRRGITLFEIAISALLVLMATGTILVMLPRVLRAQEESRFRTLASAKILDLATAFTAMPTQAVGLDVEIDPEAPTDAAVTNGPRGRPWDCHSAYKGMTFDLEAKLASLKFGLQPLPLDLARRIDSDQDEIREILEAGGQLYYGSPQAIYGFGAKTADSLKLGNETSRLVIGILGHAQANAMPVLPWRSQPYYQGYPAPPSELRREHLYLDDDLLDYRSAGITKGLTGGTNKAWTSVAGSLASPQPDGWPDPNPELIRHTVFDQRDLTMPKEGDPRRPWNYASCYKGVPYTDTSVADSIPRHFDPSLSTLTMDTGDPRGLDPAHTGPPEELWLSAVFDDREAGFIPYVYDPGGLGTRIRRSELADVAGDARQSMGELGYYRGYSHFEDATGTPKRWPQWWPAMPLPPHATWCNDNKYNSPDLSSFPQRAEQSRRYAAIAWWFAKRGVSTAAGGDFDPGLNVTKTIGGTTYTTSHAGGDLPAAFLTGERPASEEEIAHVLANSRYRSVNVMRLNWLAHAAMTLTRHFPLANVPRTPLLDPPGTDVTQDDPASSFVPENLADGVVLGQIIWKYPTFAYPLEWGRKNPRKRSKSGNPTYYDVGSPPLLIQILDGPSGAFPAGTGFLDDDYDGVVDVASDRPFRPSTDPAFGLTTADCADATKVPADVYAKWSASPENGAFREGMFYVLFDPYGNPCFDTNRNGTWEASDRPYDQPPIQELANGEGAWHTPTNHAAWRRQIRLRDPVTRDELYRSEDGTSALALARLTQHGVPFEPVVIGGSSRLVVRYSMQQGVGWNQAVGFHDDTPITGRRLKAQPDRIAGLSSSGSSGPAVGRWIHAPGTAPIGTWPWAPGTPAGVREPIPVLTYKRLVNIYESAMRLTMRYAASCPYDWGAARPTNRALMMDIPLMEWDVGGADAGATVPLLAGSLGLRDAAGAVLPGQPRQWRPITPQAVDPTVFLVQSAFGNEKSRGVQVQVPWGDRGNVSLTARFSPDQRCRQVVVWAVDWQSYQDFETAPAAPVDASRYPSRIFQVTDHADNTAARWMAPYPNRNLFWNDRLQQVFRHAEKPYFFSAPADDVPTGTRVRGPLSEKDGRFMYNSAPALAPSTFGQSVYYRYETYKPAGNQGVFRDLANGHYGFALLGFDAFNYSNDAVWWPDQGLDDNDYNRGGPANAWINPRTCFSGLWGADRNNNQRLDRGPLPTEVRLRATTVARFNLYDPRLPLTLR